MTLVKLPGNSLPVQLLEHSQCLALKREEDAPSPLSWPPHCLCQHSGSALQHLTWLMQLDSLALSEIWLYSSSQVGNFGGRRISTESRRSRLLLAERGCEGVPMAGAVLGQSQTPCPWPEPSAHGPSARHGHERRLRHAWQH